MSKAHWYVNQRKKYSLIDEEGNIIDYFRVKPDKQKIKMLEKEYFCKLKVVTTKIK